MKMTFAKVRKKPVEVEACLWDPDEPRIAETVVNALFNAGVEHFVTDDGSLMIRTLEGDMKAEDGDIVIKGVNGEFYPCKREMFLKTYDFIELGEGYNFIKRREEMQEEKKDQVEETQPDATAPNTDSEAPVQEPPDDEIGSESEDAPPVQ